MAENFASINDPATAIMRATAERIASLMKLTEQDCEFCINPAPSPVAGPVYIGVHGVRSRCLSHNDEQIDETYSLEVTISVRSRGVSRERSPHKLLSGDAGVLVIADRLRVTIHNDYELIRLANSYLPGNACGFFRSFDYESCSEPMERPGAWWGSKSGQEFSGVSVTMSFGGARIIRESTSLRVLS